MRRNARGIGTHTSALIGGGGRERFFVHGGSILFGHVLIFFLTLECAAARVWALKGNMHTFALVSAGLVLRTAHAWRANTRGIPEWSVPTRIAPPIPGLQGVFLRNGPNPIVLGRDEHTLEGDGMVHSVAFFEDGVWYSNHQLKTPRARIERAAQRAVFPRIGALRGMFGLARAAVLSIAAMGRVGSPANRIHPLERGSANAAVVFHRAAGRVYALSDDGAPFNIRVGARGAISSVGFERFGGALENPVNAHPKEDTRTGELRCIGYDMSWGSPDFSYTVIDRHSRITRCVRATLPDGKRVLHDWAASATRGVVVDCPLRMNLTRVFDGAPPLAFDASSIARFGVFPLNMTDASDIIWIDAPNAFFTTHFVAAYDGDCEKLVLIATRAPTFDLSYDPNTVNRHTRLEEWTLDVATRHVRSVRSLCTLPCEFPTTAVGGTIPARADYALVSLAHPHPFCGITRIDLRDSTSAPGAVWRNTSWRIGEVVISGEGRYAITIGTREGDRVSHVLVFDEEHIERGPAYALELPCAVPEGTHGVWVTSESDKM